MLSQSRVVNLFYKCGRTAARSGLGRSDMSSYSLPQTAPEYAKYMKSYIPTETALERIRNAPASGESTVLLLSNRRHAAPFLCVYLRPLTPPPLPRPSVRNEQAVLQVAPIWQRSVPWGGLARGGVARACDGILHPRAAALHLRPPRGHREGEPVPSLRTHARQARQALPAGRARAGPTDGHGRRGRGECATGRCGVREGGCQHQHHSGPHARRPPRRNARRPPRATRVPLAAARERGQARGDGALLGGRAVAGAAPALAPRAHRPRQLPHL